MISVKRSTSTQKGIGCCCFRCFTCINLHFLTTEFGVIKVAELILGSCCQSLAINFGLNYAATVGYAYQGFLTTASWCMMTTFLLLFCYVISQKTLSLIPQTMFETVFNALASFSYISSSSYLALAVNTYLYPMYLIIPHFTVYPALTAAYVLGSIVGLIHGYETYKAYRYFKGYR